jgi:putative RNA 2'-phosphotransferase
MRQRQQRQESLAKLLSYILCRRPDEFGLVLDEAGRLPVKELLWALAQEEGWGYVRRSHLEEVVNLVSSGAFELDNIHIRALQPGPAKLRSQESVWPPPLLYRSITAKSHAVVAARGLRPPTAGELVLASNPEMARRLGQRRDPQAVLVTIQAQNAAKRGVKFFSYGEGLYLAVTSTRNIYSYRRRRKNGSQTCGGETATGAADSGLGVAGHPGAADETVERKRSQKRPGLERGSQGAAAREARLIHGKGKDGCHNYFR